MLNKDEIPMGFTMALANHTESLNRFASMTHEEQMQIINQAKNISSKPEMQSLVQSLSGNTAQNLQSNKGIF